MKYKFDFVTNSSSSSFVVMGAYIDSSLITEEHLDFIKKNRKAYYNDEELTLDDVQHNMYEYIVLFVEDSNLDYSNGGPWEDDGHIILGLQYSEMKSNETLDDFRERAKRQIKDTMNIDVEVGHIQECWEDR